MKYIKLFEAYKVDENVKDLINWNLIEDAKDLSLEYIDEGGLKLVIVIYALITDNKTDEKDHLLYYISFDHTEDKIQSIYGKKFIKNICAGLFPNIHIKKIKYDIRLCNGSNINDCYTIISDKIGKMYPDEEMLVKTDTEVDWDSVDLFKVNGKWVIKNIVMKHIKLFEAYKDEINVRIKDLINWDLINDAKDMALEYIDNGFTLYIDIIGSRKNAFCGVGSEDSTINVRVYRLQYNHDMDRLIYMPVGNFIPLIEYIKYEFFLFGGDIISKYPTNKFSNTIELINRLKEAYPNEIIGE